MSMKFSITLVMGGIASATAANAALVTYHEFEEQSSLVFTDSAGNYDGTATAASMLDTTNFKIGTGSASFNGSQLVNSSTWETLMRIL